MSMLVPVLIAGGGVAWVASQGAAPAPGLPGPPRQLAPNGGSTVQQQQQQGGSPSGFTRITPTAGLASGLALQWSGPIVKSSGGMRVVMPGGVAGSFTRSAAYPNPLENPSGTKVASATSTIDPEVQKKLDQAKAYLEEQWKNADEVAKAKAADKLNKELKLDPPLTGHETWGEMWAVVAGAAGTAACAATGYGAAVAPLCGIVSAWLGQKLGDWMEKKWPAIKAWAAEKWGDVEDAAGDAYDWFSSAF